MNSKDKQRKRIVLLPLTMVLLLISTTTFSLQSQNTFGQQTTKEITNTTASTSTSNQLSSENTGSALKLSQSNVPIDIPMMKGYQNGREIFFIATDASDNQTAATITNQTGFIVNVSPVLSKITEPALNQAYGFTNGIPGAGPFGFQLPVVARGSL